MPCHLITRIYMEAPGGSMKPIVTETPTVMDT